MRAPLQFTFRDLCWLTLVVALIIGWWVDQNALEKRYRAKIEKLQADPLKDMLRGIMAPLPTLGENTLDKTKKPDTEQATKATP